MSRYLDEVHDPRAPLVDSLKPTPPTPLALTPEERVHIANAIRRAQLSRLRTLSGLAAKTCHHEAQEVGVNLKEGLRASRAARKEAWSEWKRASRLGRLLYGRGGLLCESAPFMKI